MNNQIAWLLSGDISIQYWVHRYLLRSPAGVLASLQSQIGKEEGFAAAYLRARSAAGHWGQYYYQPKWTSTHYTLLDLKNLQIDASCAPCREMIFRMFAECSVSDGGINLAKSDISSDICVDGMILDYVSYFCPDEKSLFALLHYMLRQQKKDGGFTWHDAPAGDPHSTICVLEGFQSFQEAFPNCYSSELTCARKSALQYLFDNSLFLQEAKYQRLSYPFRYFYDILRVLVYCANNEVPVNATLHRAVGWLKTKQRADGLWHLENVYRGQVHVQLEEHRRPSRFLTMMALWVLDFYSN